MFDDRKDISLRSSKAAYAPVGVSKFNLPSPADAFRELDRYESLYAEAFPEVRRELAKEYNRNIDMVVRMIFKEPKEPTREVLQELDTRIGNFYSYCARMWLSAKFKARPDVISPQVKNYCALTRDCLDFEGNDDPSFREAWCASDHPEMSDFSRYFVTTFRDNKSFLALLRSHPLGSHISLNEYIDSVLQGYKAIHL